MTASPAFSETLREALAKTYQTNPTLLGQRAALRATDENVPQALSGWRPTVSANGSYGYSDTKSRLRNSAGGGTQRFSTDPGNFNIGLDQPIFNGFQTVNNTRQAESNVQAGRAQLAGTEQSVLFSAVQAFMFVIRDRRILDLQRKNVQVLQEQLRSTNARFEVGDNTRTDVAQSQARLAESQSNLSTAEANLAISVGDYIQIVGQAPGSLTFPDTASKLAPDTIDRAIQVAEGNNPNVINAEFLEKAQGYQVEVLKGVLMPTVSLSADYYYSSNNSVTAIRTDQVQVLGNLQIPLYQGGGEYANVRQAKQTRNQLQMQIVETRRSVREVVVQAWNQLVSARETIVSAREQVRAQQLAYEGVRLEAEAGTRTTLDVLNAESELVRAQVLVVQAEVNTVVASYALVSAVGRLNAMDLKLPVQIYDPSIYYNKVRNLWFGLDTPSAE
ncbi:outer membrane protein [Rhodoligotrophos appendicifer]|uniref:TolC family outer membrane protein n=1 Tax=Rhodoligotrophos appendicifer TaxID=987056 RepID=UPI001478A0E7|nr:TolC family outer membrane protein [Rhodoligotrophos appendicifer]